LFQSSPNLQEDKLEIKEKIIEKILLLIALSSISILALIALFIFGEGIPFIWKIGPADFLLGKRWVPSHGEFGILPMIVGSFWVTFGSLLLGIPLGLACAVFLCEWTPPKAAMVLRPAIQLLAAIPSVIYGFWGLVVLVPLVRNYLGGPGLSIFSGSIILGFMILPTIISISEDSLRALPPSYKAGGLALGATHWQTIWRVLVPAAKSGIVASVILGMGRAIGETMAMIMILGNAVKMPNSFLDSARTLTTNIGIEMGYASGDHRQALFATGVILFFIIMILNSSAIIFSRRRIG
jgi:phosphate transport system permease protein